MDACEEYARRWAKKEDVEVDTLSEWIKSIADDAEGPRSPLCTQVPFLAVKNGIAAL